MANTISYTRGISYIQHPHRAADIERRNQLIERCLEIISAEPIDACTARRLSEDTGINRAYIHFWFGGKTGLLRSAEEVLLERIAKRIETSGRGDLRHPDVATAARLSAYLYIHDPEFAYPDRRPIVTAIAANLSRNYGLDEDHSRLLAKFLLGSLLAANVFDAQLDALKDLDRLEALAFQMISGLAAQPSNPVPPVAGAQPERDEDTIG